MSHHNSHMSLMEVINTCPKPDLTCLILFSFQVITMLHFRLAKEQFVWLAMAVKPVTVVFERMNFLQLSTRGVVLQIWCWLGVTATPCGKFVSSSGAAVACR